MTFSRYNSQITQLILKRDWTVYTQLKHFILNRHEEEKEYSIKEALNSRKIRYVWDIRWQLVLYFSDAPNAVLASARDYLKTSLSATRNRADRGQIWTITTTTVTTLDNNNNNNTNNNSKNNNNNNNNSSNDNCEQEQQKVSMVFLNCKQCFLKKQLNFKKCYVIQKMYFMFWQDARCFWLSVSVRTCTASWTLKPWRSSDGALVVLSSRSSCL